LNNIGQDDNSIRVEPLVGSEYNLAARSGWFRLISSANANESGWKDPCVCTLSVIETHVGTLEVYRSWFGALI
jgi:hypothetical protein